MRLTFDWTMAHPHCATLDGFAASIRSRLQMQSENVSWPKSFSRLQHRCQIKPRAIPGWIFVHHLEKGPSRSKFFSKRRFRGARVALASVEGCNRAFSIQRTMTPHYQQQHVNYTVRSGESLRRILYCSHSMPIISMQASAHSLPAFPPLFSLLDAFNTLVFLFRHTNCFCLCLRAPNRTLSHHSFDVAFRGGISRLKLHGLGLHSCQHLTRRNV